MPKVTFVASDGTRTDVETPAGTCAMRTALNQNVTGIIGECGGAMACATCHVYVDPAWTDTVGPRKDGEIDLLEFAASEMKPESRLACQIVLSDALDGLVLHLPEAQI